MFSQKKKANLHTLYTIKKTVPGENANVQLVQFLKILNVGPDEWNTLRTHMTYSKKGFVFSVLGKEGGGYRKVVKKFNLRENYSGFTGSRQQYKG